VAISVQYGNVVRITIERDSDTFVLEGITQFKFATIDDGAQEITSFGNPRRQFIGGTTRFEIEAVASSIRFAQEPQVETVLVEFEPSPPVMIEPAEEPREETVRRIRFNDGGGDDGGEGKGSQG
jgi:hypothetical protein